MNVDEGRKTGKQEQKDYRGSTATKWKGTCQQCGHVERGDKRPGQTARKAAATPTPSSVSPAPIPTPLDDDGNQVDEMTNLAQQCATRFWKCNMSWAFRCRCSSWTRPTTSAKSPCKRTMIDDEPIARLRKQHLRLHRPQGHETPAASQQTVGSWIRSSRGRIHNDVYVNDVSYTKMLIGKIKRCMLSQGPRTDHFCGVR